MMIEQRKEGGDLIHRVRGELETTHGHVCSGFS